MKLYRRQDIWWVSQWDKRQGKQVRISTEETDKDEAARKALRLIAPLLLSRDADLVEDAAATVKRLRGESARLTAASISLVDCWKKSPHVGRSGEKLKDSTTGEAKRIWTQFVDFALAGGCKVMADVTQTLAEGFLGQHGQRSRVVCYHICRAMFSRLGVDPNPFSRRPPGRAAVMHREPLTGEQIKALLEEVDRLAAAGPGRSAPDAAEFAVFVRFLLYTGLRLGDAATAKVSQVDYSAGVMERTMAKTGRRVRFPLHPDLLQRLCCDGEYVFPSMAAKYLKRPDTLTRRFRNVLAGLGIQGLPHQYCAHALRTTFASICASRGIPLATIQSWLGQECPSVTRIYARVEDMRLKKEAMAKFPTLGE